MPTTVTYQIRTGSYDSSAPTFTSSPYTCLETITYSLLLQAGGAPPSYVVLNASTRVVKITSTDTSLHGTALNLRVRVTRSQGSNTDLDFTLTMNDPCRTTTLTTQAISAATVKIGSTAEYTFNELADS
jgi:hypothetical protein